MGRIYISLSADETRQFEHFFKQEIGVPFIPFFDYSSFSSTPEEFMQNYGDKLSSFPLHDNFYQTHKIFPCKLDETAGLAINTEDFPGIEKVSKDKQFTFLVDHLQKRRKYLPLKDESDKQKYLDLLAYLKSLGKTIDNGLSEFERVKLNENDYPREAYRNKYYITLGIKPFLVYYNDTPRLAINPDIHGHCNSLDDLLRSLCKIQGVEYSDFCERHGGTQPDDEKEKKNKSNQVEITRYDVRPAQLPLEKESDQQKYLRFLDYLESVQKPLDKSHSTFTQGSRRYASEVYENNQYITPSIGIRPYMLDKAPNLAINPKIHDCSTVDDLLKSLCKIQGVEYSDFCAWFKPGDEKEKKSKTHVIEISDETGSPPHIPQTSHCKKAIYTVGFFGLTGVVVNNYILATSLEAMGGQEHVYALSQALLQNISTAGPYHQWNKGAVLGTTVDAFLLAVMICVAVYYGCKAYKHHHPNDANGYHPMSEVK